MTISPIISVSELLRIYQQPHVRLFDASGGAQAKSNFETEHLEGAQHIDLNTQLAAIQEDVSIGGRHPLPTPGQFAAVLTAAGISRETHVVIYDTYNGSNAAARFWWMLKAVGHEKVQVLNGGLQEAKAQHFPTSSTEIKVEPAEEKYLAEHWQLPIISMAEVERISKNPDYLVIDVRDESRYHGKTEPIDLVAGHIPGAINVPFAGNLDANGLFLDPAALKEKYTVIFGGRAAANTVVHCGSGVTACHTLLAIAYAGLALPQLYVGSWSEWSRNGKPVAREL